MRSGRPPAAASLLLLLLSLSLSSLPVHGRTAEDEFPNSLDAAASSVLSAVSEASGWKRADLALARVDAEAAQAGQSVLYSFAVAVNGARSEVVMAEEIAAWEPLLTREALPAGREGGKGEGEGEGEEEGVGVGEEGKGGRGRGEGGEWAEGGRRVGGEQWKGAELPPFELAGPLELWIQDAGQLRLAMPHDVDAGEVKKVVLADGATVTVHGAQGVSLARPLDLPLPLSQKGEGRRGKEEGEAMAELMALTDRLRASAKSQSLKNGARSMLALRIVKPSALVASPPKLLLGETEGKRAPASGNLLKVKRISAGAVELLSWKREEKALQTTLEGETDFAWPLPQVNQSDARFQSFEKALLGLLGKRAFKKGNFQVLAASVTPVSLIKMQFDVNCYAPEGTKPAPFPGGMNLTADSNNRLLMFKQRWEVLISASPDGKLQPMRIKQLRPIMSTVSLSYNVMSKNGSYFVQD